MHRETLAEEIQQSVDILMATLSKFSNEQLNIVPFSGSWTAGQIADHIRKATDGLPDTNTRPANRDPALYVETLKSLFLDFTAKYESPHFILPDAGPFQTDALLRELARVKNTNAEIALTRDLTHLCLDFEMPGLGYLTRYEWLNFMVAHTQRHAYQLKNTAEKILAVNV